MKVTIIGAGSWGTAMSIYMASCGHEIHLWAYEEGLADTINHHHVNPLYLDGFPIPDNVTATDDVMEALKQEGVIFLAIPSQFIRRTLKDVASSYQGQPLVCLSKGIEQGTLSLMSEVLTDILGTGLPLLALSGPTFAREVAGGLPAAAVLASTDLQLCGKLQEAFSSEKFRFYRSDDLIGVELAGALKNVIALAAGVVDGYKLGLNAAAALMTRGLHEITRLGVELGGRRETFAGLAGMGDLILTCTGHLSRNRTVGVRLGKGETLEDILGSMNMVAEGVATTASTFELARSRGVEMPLTESVYDLLYSGIPPGDIVLRLMTRNLKREDVL
ncbi:MAG TPA: NAD(P)H-dependent glycerol-3-phosphate dehydrogenase [Thermoanaerobaculia bacterium]|nr:NAD(P)H-dependent glycerol-3-phosphate dehydrogenase [Thermoanaerobaculia bacterium]HUM30821.1 NAD(P)H-dependent glycerol-3-phosphate dehydrogenase [Thermoanaerobaculia bacterium]HXK69156.1 NAD(P)H-dependent glycerol-3-phosphate dehydrogenase [Thermoanaerobaculia bacterium]